MADQLSKMAATIIGSTIIIQFLVFEEKLNNIKINLCAKGDIDRREPEVNITFQTLIILFFYFSLLSVWLLLSKKGQVTPNLIKFFSMSPNRGMSTISAVATQYHDLFGLT